MGKHAWSACVSTLLLCFMLIYNSSSGQDKKEIDRLLKKLNTPGLNDTAKINTYLQLAETYLENDYKKTITYCDIAAPLSKSLMYPHGLIEVNYLKGRALMRMGNADSAMHFLKLSLKYGYVFKISKNRSGVLNTMGMACYDGAKLKLALQYYLEAEKQNLFDNDTVLKIAILNNIGNLFIAQENYAKALDYHKKSLTLSLKRNEKFRIASSYNNLGLIYKAQKDFPNAIQCFTEANKIAQELNMLFGIALTNSNLGNVYSAMKNYDKAIDHFFIAEKVYQKMSDNKGLSKVYSNIAGTYLKKNMYPNAIHYGEKCLELAQKINSHKNISDACEILSQAYAGIKNFDKAYHLSRMYSLYMDTLNDANTQKQMTEMQAKYETEKKEKELQLLNKEKEKQAAVAAQESKRQKQIIYSIAIVLLLSISFAIYAYISFRQKKKANIMLNNQQKLIQTKNEMLVQQYEEILTQRDEIKTQRDLVSSQKEQIEQIYTEISDSINYAKQIQKAALQASLKTNKALSGYFIMFHPKNVVSGDFYWSKQIGNTFIVAVADCTGHGVPGAFMSMLAISFLNEIARKKEITNAAEALNQLRELVIDALQQNTHSYSGISVKDGLDMALCEINLETLEVNFAGANNPMIYVNVTPSKEPILTEIKGDKMPVAIFDKMHPFTNHKIQLTRNDTIYLSSDGFQDQFGGPNRKKFLKKNLKNLLLQNSMLPLNEQHQILENTFQNWISNDQGIIEQTDDITIMGFKI